MVPHNVVNGAEGINHFVDFGGSAPPSPNDAVALLGPVTSERQFPDASQAFDLSDRGMANGEPGYPSINQNGESETCTFSVKPCCCQFYFYLWRDHY